jgi:predicted aldo/keto reductase-like oxidoreductase
MVYRKFSNTDIRLSQLGFGCMRLPLVDINNPAAVDEKAAAGLLHYAIERGVNYIDTAHPYHREMSERFVGKALTDEYRDRVYLATKLPMWHVKSRQDCDRLFDEQSRRLRTDKIKMYLLHALNKRSWKTVQEHDVLSFLDALKRNGKIHYAGFSFHDELPLFKEIVDAYPWSFCLIHLNYVDCDFQAGVRGLEYAYKKGLAVQIMEPLRGGKLAQHVPEEITAIIARTGRSQTPAQFALRWLFNRVEVCCVLSGMSSLEEVRENADFASSDHVETVSEKEMELYAEARALYRARTRIHCTQCGYCMPCEQKIPISFILELYNDAYMYNSRDDSCRAYRVFIEPENRPDNCIQCGVCEEKCPQQVPIVESLAAAHRLFTED